MLSVATLGAWVLIRFKDTNKSKQIKWVLFVLYFWVLNFIQLIILAIVYYLQSVARM